MPGPCSQPKYWDSTVMKPPKPDLTQYPNRKSGKTAYVRRQKGQSK